MTDDERSFNYNDLNLDFLELSPPRAKPEVRLATTPIPRSSSFRPSAFKATQLAQRVVQNDALVNKIEYLKRENFELQQKLKDFQKSAFQIQRLYENEKQANTDVQIQLKAAELKSNELETFCARLKNDVAEKKLQVEQLEAQLDEAKGPLSYTELAVKFLRLVQKVNEEDTLKLFVKHERSLYSDLSKYCESKGCKIPIVISKKRRVYKRDREVQCNLFEAVNLPISKKFQTQSTQTATAQQCQRQTQTGEAFGRDMHTQTQQLETSLAKSLLEKAVQTTIIELRTQSTQHISTTTTRGTSTTCFIKKHNVGTCFPEPTFVSPVTAMVDELLQLYNVTPLSPISDPLTLTSYDEIELSTTPSITPVPVSFKSIGTCTYLCNVQRQLDFIPIITTIKRSQSSSPALFTCDSVKNEAYATPIPSPPASSDPTPSAASHKRNVAAISAADCNNLSNMQPMLSAFAQLPDMQPEVFSIIWQMAGQMFMGLMYPPTNNSMRMAQLNRSQNSLNQEQFHNWITTLYESMQQPPQQPTPTPLPQTEYQHHASGRERSFDFGTEISESVIHAHNPAHREVSQVAREVYNVNTNEMNDLHSLTVFGADESTQTDNAVLSSNPDLCEAESNFVDWIFKEPLEIPKKSAKQTLARKATAEEATYVKKKDKRTPKKRKKEKQEKVAKLTRSSTQPHVEQDFANAVEFCAKLCHFNEDIAAASERWEVHCANSTANVNQPIALAEQDDYCEYFGRIEDMEAAEKNDREANVDNSCEKDEVHSQVELNKHIEKIRVVKSVEVPDNTLSDSENSKCDKLDNIEPISETEAPPEIFENQLAKKCNTAYSIFGSDSEEEDEINSYDSKNFEIDLVSSEACMLLEKPKEPFDSNITSEVKENLSKDSDKLAESMGDCYNKINHNDYLSKSSHDAVEGENLLKPTRSADSKETAPGARFVPQKFLGIALSETESEENGAGSPSLSINPVFRCNSESISEGDDTDDPILVIVEKVPDEVNAKRTISEPSIEPNPLIDNIATTSQIHKQFRLQQSGADRDISVLLQHSIGDDLLGNASSQKLLNSTLLETANEMNETQVSSPRRRGRKRKSEMPAITFCKRSERLRTKLKQNAELSSDESLKSPSKHTHNRQKTTESCDLEDVQNGISWDGENASQTNPAGKSPLQSITKEQIGKKYQRFLDLKQQANISKADNRYFTENPDNNFNKEVSSNDVGINSAAECDKQFDIDSPPIEQVEEKAVSSLHQSNAYPFPEFSKRGSVSCTTNTTCCSNSFEPEAAHCSSINQIDCDTPLSPPAQSTAHTCPELSESDSMSCTSNTTCTISCPCPQSGAQTSAHCLPISRTDYDTPSSPLAALNVDISFGNTQQCRAIPLELNRAYYPYAQKNLLQHLINNYSADIYATVTGIKKQLKIETNFAAKLEDFLNNTREKVDVVASTLAASLHDEFRDCEVIASLIIDQIGKAARPEVELDCELASVPRKYLGTHLRLISIVLRHLHFKRPEAAAVLSTKIENRLFNYQHSKKISASVALNLTQLYLLVIPLHNSQHNPARLFLAKCLYYYNVISIPMIYEVLCWYPTTLPHRDEPNYDRSDALIIVIQHLLMCTTYNMDSKDLRHRELLSLLRFEYHFEPFQPKALEVLCNLVTKLKTGHLTQLKYAFAIFCKRQTKLVDILLQQQLLPLADEYYKLVQRSNEYDERIAALLECISVVVKPLPLDTDVSLYISIFERFLGAVQRPIVQEAAVLAILRLQRFGQNRCFHALAHFKPHYPLQMLTANALKTFIHKKPFNHWKSLLLQAVTK